MCKFYKYIVKNLTINVEKKYTYCKPMQFFFGGKCTVYICMCAHIQALK